MPYKVRELAELAGVSVRTLHHYDEIDLLKPGEITPAGYRLYKDRELERLQQILFYREIGFPLKEIKAILDSPGFDRRHALIAHRKLLAEQKKRLENLISTVDKTIQALEGGSGMDQKDMFKGFDKNPLEEHRKKYAREAREKYGAKVVEQAEKRAESYTQEDWSKISGEWEDIYRRVIERMDQGPADPQVQEAVHRLRQLITDSFYDCTPDIFRGLGDLYVTDERFTANIDKYKPGLAAFLRNAMHIFCDNLAKEDR